ncbi:MAG: bifunctional phosphoglucose/phosphomannose isomerase [Candidatus Woesearchaeota archaeon]
MDDEKIKQVDKSSYITDLEAFPQHIMEGFKLPESIKVDKKSIDKIIVAGMGGSAMPGDILKAYMKYNSKTPIFVNRNYKLPAFADKNTLIFIVSYSGNTEETIECFREALRKGCQIVAVTSGGKIKELAALHKKPLVEVPKNKQPRAMVAYLFFSMLRMLVSYGMLRGVKKDVEALSEYLKTSMFKEKAEELAKNLLDKIPLIYASDDFYPVAMRFKTQINENAKIHAFWDTVPEMNHNEIVGYTELYGKYHMVIFGSDSDHQRIKKRFDICKKLVKSKGVTVTQMNFAGNSLLKQMFTAIHMGDWTSYYMAVLKGVDPSPVEIIENLKKELKR